MLSPLRTSKTNLVSHLFNILALGLLSNRFSGHFSLFHFSLDTTAKIHAQPTVFYTVLGTTEPFPYSVTYASDSGAANRLPKEAAFPGASFLGLGSQKRRRLGQYFPSREQNKYT